MFENQPNKISISENLLRLAKRKLEVRIRQESLGEHQLRDQRVRRLPVILL